jgi:hypothetical protein
VWRGADADAPALRVARRKLGSAGAQAAVR